jgi:hypothetical protein
MEALEESAQSLQCLLTNGHEFFYGDNSLTSDGKRGLIHLDNELYCKQVPLQALQFLLQSAIQCLVFQSTEHSYQTPTIYCLFHIKIQYFSSSISMVSTETSAGILIILGLHKLTI